MTQQRLVQGAAAEYLCMALACLCSLFRMHLTKQPPSLPCPPLPGCSNAMNALSEDMSLLQMPVWRNPWLLVAMTVSLGLHALIL